MPIRIMVVDDHPLVREGLLALLARAADITVVAEADRGEEALRLCLETRPDVLLLDLTLPDLSGLAVARRLRSEAPAIRILILSMHADRRFISEAVAVGVSGYILKDAASEELLRAIRSVAAGGTFFSQPVTAILIKHLTPQTLPGALTPQPPLTSRETEVLQLLAQGKNTKEIALLLKVSGKTVETFRANLMRKLQLKNIAELTRYAIRTGLVTL